MLEKIKIYFDKKWEPEKTYKERGEEINLEVESDKVIIPLKIKKLNSHRFNRPRWEFDLPKFRKFINFAVESPTIAYKNNKSLKFDTLLLCYGDKTNEITNIEDYIYQGAEIKLRLDKNFLEQEEDPYDYLVVKEYKEKDEQGNQLCLLEVYSNYEIITPNKTISFANSFPTEETPKTNSLLINKKQILNNLDKVSVCKLKTVEYPNFEKQPTKYELEEEELKTIKQTLIAKIKTNPQEWKISEELKVDFGGVIKSDKRTTLLLHKSAQLKRTVYGALITDCGKIHYKKGFTKEEWEEIENILNNSPNIKNQEQIPNNEKWEWKDVAWYGGILLIVLLIIWWIARKVRNV